jgi:predicted RNase H-like HicB family nuclease
MSVDYTVSIWKEGNQFIAHAMPLDVASAGATPDAARAALDEAVRLFLATSIEMGTIDQVLDEAGYERTDNGWQSPPWIATERHAATVGA